MTTPTQIKSKASKNGATVQRRLNVGAGSKPHEGFETMDISPVFSPDFQHDLLSFPWPFADETFDELLCEHVLEHVESGHRVAVMNEMYRILKPGGFVTIEVPVFPYWVAIADPTHVSFFVRQSFWYFCRERFQSGDDYSEHQQLYGIKTWSMRGEKRDSQGSILRVELERPA